MRRRSGLERELRDLERTNPVVARASRNYERVRDNILREGTKKSVTPAKHMYVSTACQHDLHHSCRRECKYCKERCLCPCHAGKVTPPPGSVREVKP